MASELLTFQPTELKFPYLPAKPGKSRKFELKKQISCSLRLINNTEDYVAFKVKTTSPKKYSVRPNAGAIAPQASIDIIITMQAQREAPPDLQCKDKFLVQSVRAQSGITTKDVTPELFAKEDGKDVFENKLKVVYVPPPQPPSPVAESAEEGREDSPDRGDWGFSLSEQPRDTSELEQKISEVRFELSAMEKERNVLKDRSQYLQNELSQTSITSKSQLRFSFLIVFLVGILGILVGYFLRH